MDVEHVRKAARQEPFQAFTLRLSDGRSIAVRHPEFIAISPSLVAVIGEDGFGASHIDPSLIVSIDFDRRKAA